MSTAIGVFNSRDDAEAAVAALHDKGFTEREISLVAKKGAEDDGDEEEGAMSNDLTTGAATGGAIGGVAGLLAGVGALAIPGVGPILAAGPLAAGLSGALAGGLAGGLVDWGIPADRGKFYEGKVKSGDTLALVKTDDDRAEAAASILKAKGGADVEIH